MSGFMDDLPDEVLLAIIDGQLSVEDALAVGSDPPARAGTGRADQACPLIPASDFMEGPREVSWLWDDLIPEGSLVVLHGRPKCGKSLFALNLSVAQCISRPFLKRTCRGARVGLVLLEDPAVIIRNRLDRMVDFVPEGLFISAGGGWGAAQRCNLQDYIEKLSIQLLIIDPLIKWKPGTRENVAEEIGLVMYDLQNIVQKTGCTILVIHHNRKAGGDYGDSLRGSSAILGSCDVALELVREDSGTAVLKVVSRLSIVEDERLELDPESLTWYSLGPAAGAKVKRRRDEIVRIIRAQGPIGREGIASEVGESKSTVWRDLELLTKQGLIRCREERLENGRKGKVYYV